MDVMPLEWLKVVSILEDKNEGPDDTGIGLCRWRNHILLFLDWAM